MCLGEADVPHLPVEVRGHLLRIGSDLPLCRDEVSLAGPVATLCHTQAELVLEPLADSLSASHLAEGALRLQMCTTASGFLFGFLGSSSGHQTCVSNTFSCGAILLA